MDKKLELIEEILSTISLVAYFPGGLSFTLEAHFLAPHFPVTSVRTLDFKPCFPLSIIRLGKISPEVYSSRFFPEEGCLDYNP